MPFIGNKPTAVPLTSADITDGIISSAKIATGAITSAKLASGVGVIAEADQWRLITDVSADTSPVTAWERVDTAGQEKLGTGMTLSSGLFTYPSTGLWLVTYTACVLEGSAIDSLIQFDFYFNSTRLAQILLNTPFASAFTTGTNSSLVNVTNVSHTSYFALSNIQNSQVLRSSSEENLTCASFIRLGDSV